MMGTARNSHGSEEKCIETLVGRHAERDHYTNLDIGQARRDSNTKVVITEIEWEGV
jgi:hypothetical protein